MRIRFRLTERTDYYFSPTTRRYTFASVSDDEIPANARISQGMLSVTVTGDKDNPVTKLALGDEFYFDITPVPAK